MRRERSTTGCPGQVPGHARRAPGSHPAGQHGHDREREAPSGGAGRNDFTNGLSDGLTDEEAGLGFIDRATVRTDVDLEHMVDLDRMGQAMTGMAQALATDPGRKVVITKNG